MMFDSSSQSFSLIFSHSLFLSFFLSFSFFLSLFSILFLLLLLLHNVPVKAAHSFLIQDKLFFFVILPAGEQKLEFIAASNNRHSVILLSPFLSLLFFLSFLPFLSSLSLSLSLSLSISSFF